jgi:uncharacterized protein YgiM (DUF1202 family)
MVQWCRRVSALAALWPLVATPGSAQSVTVARDVNLRSDPSTEYPANRLLTPSEPRLTLLEPAQGSGYYHVRTASGDEGCVWVRNVTVSAAPAAPSGTPPTTRSRGVTRLSYRDGHDRRCDGDAVAITGALVTEKNQEIERAAPRVEHQGAIDSDGSRSLRSLGE